MDNEFVQHGAAAGEREAGARKNQLVFPEPLLHRHG